MTSIAFAVSPLRSLTRSRGLVWAWTLRTIRARYEQSALGWLWALAQPAAQVAIFTLVFTRFVRVDTGDTPYIVFSYVALTPWVFFSTSLAGMCGAIVENLRLVTKIYFPREVLPIASMLARLMDFGVSWLLVIALVIYYRVPVHPDRLALLPVVLGVQVLLTLGVGFIFAAANVFLRDMQPLLSLGLQLWFYLSPIIYPVALVPEQWRRLYSLNPMVGIIDGYRAVWLGQAFPAASFTWAAVLSVACLAGGYWFFKKSEVVFADIG